MNIDRKVVEQALEKLEFFAHMKSVSEDTMRLITALREALASEALDRMAENARELGLDYDAPVVTSDTSQERVDETGKQRHETQKREWVGLTEGEFRAIGQRFENDNGHVQAWMSFARHIQFALEEKNT